MRSAQPTFWTEDFLRIRASSLPLNRAGKEEWGSSWIVSSLLGLSLGSSHTLYFFRFRSTHLDEGLRFWSSGGIIFWSSCMCPTVLQGRRNNHLNSCLIQFYFEPFASFRTIWTVNLHLISRSIYCLVSLFCYCCFELNLLEVVGVWVMNFFRWVGWILFPKSFVGIWLDAFCNWQCRKMNFGIVASHFIDLCLIVFKFCGSMLGYVDLKSFVWVCMIMVYCCSWLVWVDQVG